jgi:hypothetical protein
MTGQTAEQVAAWYGIRLELLTQAEAKRGFLLVPVERSFAWAARFCRLARDYERLATILGTFHFLAFAWVMIVNLFKLLKQGHSNPLAASRLFAEPREICCRESRQLPKIAHPYFS